MKFDLSTDIDFKKAKQAFESLSLKERMKAVASLGKNTVTIIGRDKDIITPWIRMLIYNIMMISCVFYAWLGWWYQLPMEGWAIFLAIILFLYKHFYHNRQEMRLSWTVYETLIGNDPSYAAATAACKKLKSQTRKIAWLDILMAFVRRGKKSGEGFLMKLIRLFISGLEEVWDLVNHYLIPSVAVDHMDIKPAIQTMKKLKERVPESLVGVFGIDFLGTVVRKIVIPIYIVLILISAGMGVWLADYLPSTVIQGSEEPTAYWFTQLSFTWVPLVFALWVGKLFSNILERTVTSIKVIYFTIFYTKITHPERVMEELQDELVDYLTLEHLKQAQHADSAPSAAEGVASA